MSVLRPLWFLLPLLPALASCAPQAPPAASLPHIVLILADDMGIGDPGVYNPESKIPTPHIDRLAAEGIRLTDMHTPSAVCTPTRYGILTGRYAWRTRLRSGVLWGYSPALIDTNRLTLPALLDRHGYATAGIGKWHLGLGSADSTRYDRPLRPGPLEAGFDTYFGIPASLDMVPYVYFEDDRVVEPPTDSVAPSGHRRQGGGGFWRGGPIAPSFRHVDVLPALTDRAVGFIDSRAGAADEPFFLYLPLSAPHTPWVPTEPFLGASDAGYYGDFAAQVDATVGAVLDALDRNGLTDRTLVLFTSDNGAHWPADDIRRFEHRANLHYRGQKADIWEGGHRVPFVARWPGRIPAGSVSDQTASLTDLMATFASILGAELPDDAGEDSFDLLPVLTGGAAFDPVRPAVVHHSLDGMFAIRSGSWKLIEGRGSGGFTEPRRLTPGSGDPAGQLYDLSEDPGETRNLYVERPALVDSLGRLLDRFRSTGRSRPRASGAE